MKIKNNNTCQEEDRAKEDHISRIKFRIFSLVLSEKQSKAIVSEKKNSLRETREGRRKEKKRKKKR